MLRQGFYKLQQHQTICVSAKRRLLLKEKQQLSKYLPGEAAAQPSHTSVGLYCSLPSDGLCRPTLVTPLCCRVGGKSPSVVGANRVEETPKRGYAKMQVLIISSFPRVTWSWRKEKKYKEKSFRVLSDIVVKTWCPTYTGSTVSH